MHTNPLIKFVQGKIRILLIRLRRRAYRSRTSAPYLSGDAFANVAEYAPFGANGEQAPNLEILRISKSIFVPAHMLEKLILECSEEICASILITGNSDRNFVKMPRLPASVRFWLGQNLAIEESNQIKTTTIPIGLENLALGRAGLPHYFRNSNPKYLNTVLVPPMAPSNPIRQIIVNEIRSTKNPAFRLITEYMTEKAYFNLVKDYKFVLCLEGNGFENHRIWETLYRNCFPVMIRSNWSRSLEYLNCPILFIDEISEVNQDFLDEFLEQNSNFVANACEVLWIDYWVKLVRRLELKYV